MTRQRAARQRISGTRRPSAFLLGLRHLFLVFALALSACVTTACSTRVEPASESAAKADAGQVIEGNGYALGDRTNEAAVMGTANAPTLFAQDPELAFRLATGLPRARMREAGSGAAGDHMTLALWIVGERVTGKVAYLYTMIHNEWWEIQSAQVVEGSAEAGAARITLSEDGGQWRFVAFDEGVGAKNEPEPPENVADRLAALEALEQLRSPLAAHTWRMGSRWAARRLPGDRLQEIDLKSLFDPHVHTQKAAMVYSIAPKYLRSSVKPISWANRGDAVDEQRSPDGRFALTSLETGGLVVVDHERSLAWQIKLPGSLRRTPGLMKPDARLHRSPVWNGHTVVFDMDTVHHPDRPTFTHYELDCDTMTTRRAIPLGPMSLNPGERP